MRIVKGLRTLAELGDRIKHEAEEYERAGVNQPVVTVVNVFDGYELVLTPAGKGSYLQGAVRYRP